MLNKSSAALPKTLGEILYRLYGENGSDQMTHDNLKREVAVYRELERHGLVKLENDKFGRINVTRLCRGLAGKTLCETLVNQ